MALRAFGVTLLADDTRAHPFALLALKPVVANPVIALCIADMFQRKQGARPCLRLVFRFNVASSVASKADVVTHDVDPIQNSIEKRDHYSSIKITM